MGNVWISTNGKYLIRKESDGFFLLNIDHREVSIWEEDGMFITGSDISGAPKYVKNALEKHIGDILY